MSEDRISPALERALIRYRAMVRSVGFEHGLDDASIDEVFQEVRLRLWKALRSSEKIEAAPASYIYRAATTAALDLIRRRRAYPTEELDVERAPNLAPGATDRGPDAQLVTREVAAAVGRAVDTLIDSRRPVVRMYLKGYSLAEIAKLLGWSEAKARNLLYRGLADLRAKLEEAGIGPGGER